MLKKGVRLPEVGALFSIFCFFLHAQNHYEKKRKVFANAAGDGGVDAWVVSYQKDYYNL